MIEERMTPEEEALLEAEVWRERAYLLGDTLHMLVVLNCLRPELKSAAKRALGSAGYPGYE